jgi:hypothetical protein
MFAWSFGDAAKSELAVSDKVSKRKGIDKVGCSKYLDVFLRSITSGLNSMCFPLLEQRRTRNNNKHLAILLFVHKIHRPCVDFGGAIESLVGVR